MSTVNYWQLAETKKDLLLSALYRIVRYCGCLSRDVTQMVERRRKDFNLTRLYIDELPKDFNRALQISFPQYS